MDNYKCLKCDWEGKDKDITIELEDGLGNIIRLCPECGADDINHDLIKVN